jgi:hypothetical protein
VAERFVGGEGAAVAGGRGAGFMTDGAEAAAVGAGLFGGQGLGLLLQEGGQGALGQAAGGRLGELFEGEEIDVQAGAGVPESPAGATFSPAGRQFADFLEVFRGKKRAGHRLPCLGVTAIRREGRSCPFDGTVCSPAKPVQASAPSGVPLFA